MALVYERMVEQMGASAEATFLPFFKLKKPQNRHFLLKSNIHNGTFSHAFLKRKMGKKWAIYPLLPRKMGKKWGSFLRVVYEPSDSESINVIAPLNRLTQYYITDNPHFKG